MSKRTITIDIFEGNRIEIRDSKNSGVCTHTSPNIKNNASLVLVSLANYFGYGESYYPLKKALKHGKRLINLTNDEKKYRREMRRSIEKGE